MIRIAAVPVVLEELSDADELAKAKAQDERFQRNWDWFQTHCAEIYPENAGKILCIAGQETFAGETTDEAVAKAKAAHPEDDGRFTVIVPRQKGIRIYAHPWSLASVP